MRSRDRRHGVVLTAVAAVLLLTGAGCSSSGDEKADQPTPAEHARATATPARASASAADLASTRKAVTSALDDWLAQRNTGHTYPRQVTLEHGTYGDGNSVELNTPNGSYTSYETPEVKDGVALRWYVDRALDKRQITSRQSGSIPPSNGDGRRGAGYSFCVDNGAEFRIVVDDGRGTLLSQGDGRCPELVA